MKSAKLTPLTVSGKLRTGGLQQLGRRRTWLWIPERVVIFLEFNVKNDAVLHDISVCFFYYRVVLATIFKHGLPTFKHGCQISKHVRACRHVILGPAGLYPVSRKKQDTN